MEAPRPQKFLIVGNDTKFSQWVQHAIGAGWPEDAIVVMDWTSFGRVRTAMTVRDYDIVLLSLAFDEGIEEPTTDGFDWIRKLRSQPGFPEMIVLAEGGSELAAVRSLRLGAADYLPKRLLTAARLQRSIKLTLRAIEKELARRARIESATRPSAPANDSAPATKDTAAREPGAREPATDAGASRLPPYIATHTGASLAQAAQIATQAGPLAPTARPAPAGTGVPTAAAAPTPRPHIATHTGASLAKAASLALAAHPTRVDPAGEKDDPAARSLPGISTSQKLTTSQNLSTSQRLPPSQNPAVTPDAAAPQAPRAVVSPPAIPAPSLSASQSLGSSQPAPRETKPVAPDNHQIPGYTILQRIGESEAAAVYLAISDDAGHNVALKVSKRRYTGNADDTGARAIMFQREFEAIAALDHPSIIDLFDYGIHEGVEYLAMEYFPCGDLKARLQNPLTADEAITFVKEIARSLKVVHEAGIIHRDLKPPNVMLRDDGSVVLIDFGLARSLMGGESSTRTGVLRGSPYYMSPEQAQGEQLDARTDLYSLGVMLYEMLAGRKPYLGASAIDVLQQHVMAPVPELPIHHLAYQPLLERLMSKSREQRIASCDELLHALDRMSQAMSDSVVDPAQLVSVGAGS